ncbi:MAG: hypothetical protein R3C11_00725 [Planctomycetaceae bacterium]
MSPAWMLYGLERYLRRPGRKIIRWDYPQVFVDPARNVEKLSEALQNCKSPSIYLIGHSFGDWIARSAINDCKLPAIKKLISICPALAPVPFAKVFSPLFGWLIPELVVMKDPELISVPISSELSTQRTIIWARFEFIVSRPPGLEINHEVLGTHITSVFQPSLWRMVEEELASK